MVNKSSALKKRVRSLVNDLICDFNDGVFKPLASDVDTLDGLNVHGALLDEFHQWKNGKALYDIIADGITAREQPLIFMTSTAGKIREDIYDEVYEDAICQLDSYEDDLFTICFATTQIFLAWSFFVKKLLSTSFLSCALEVSLIFID